MRKLAIYIFFILAGGWVQAQNFTGIITMETENTEIGEKATVKCYIKGGRCKMEISSSSSAGTASYVLYSNPENSDLTLVAGGTTTIVPAGSVEQNKYLANILIAVPTTTKQTLSGYECTLVKMKSTQASIECMVATDLSVNMPAALQSGVLRGLKESGIAGTPLEFTVKDLSGKTVISQKVTSVVAQELNDAIFSY